MSQAEQILRMLKTGAELTPLEALQRFGCLRLAARIAELRQAGYPIQTRTVRAQGKEFAAYRLAEEEGQWQAS